MKLKLDENVHRQIAPLLIAFGHDATTVVGEGLAGTDDEGLAAVAKQKGRMLITLDRGFGDIRRYPPGQHPGMLILRLRDQRPAQVEATLRALVSTHDLDALAGCTIVVQTSLVRIRWPKPETNT